LTTFPGEIPEDEAGVSLGSCDVAWQATLVFYTYQKLGSRVDHP